MKLQRLVLLVLVLGAALGRLQGSEKNAAESGASAHKQSVTTTTSTTESNQFKGKKGNTVDESVKTDTTTTVNKKVVMTDLSGILFWTPRELRNRLGNFTGEMTLQKIIEEYASVKSELFALQDSQYLKFNELFSTTDANKFNLTYDWVTVNSLQIYDALPSVIYNTIYNQSVGLAKTQLSEIAANRTIRHVRDCKRGFVLKRFRGRDVNKLVSEAEGVYQTSKVFLILLVSCKKKEAIEIFSFAAKKTTTWRNKSQATEENRKFATRFLVNWLALNFKNIFNTCPAATEVLNSFSQTTSLVSGSEVVASAQASKK
jgi:23S rRNA U2552 (ribose-2'-O)-methylase RlmE/FtsJ